MTDGQVARPQYVSLDTPHGRLELTWPQPQQIYAEDLEPVAGIMQQDPTPAARLNGKPITVRRAGQIVAGMRRTAAEPADSPDSVGAWHLEFTRPQWRAVLAFNAEAVAVKTLAEGVFGEMAAEIDRLHAEIDGMREVPVEYATTAALEVAMNVDPARPDGSILREIGGEKRAFEWKAQAGEWVRIP